MTILTARFDDAFVYAATLHRTQQRKGSGVPYVSHLMAVSALVLEHGGDEDQAIAGLLHDAPEDQGGERTLAEIRQRFGDGVAKIVTDCSDSLTEDPDRKLAWRPRKEAYLAALPHKDKRSLLVALADKTHNAKSILVDLRRIGDDLWPRFKGGRDGTLWYYTTAADIFRAALPGELSRELDETVQGFARNKRG
jgi:(p)ppGpp synthase/HD superfamily hydrolase